MLYLQHCHLFLNATLHRVSNLNFVHNVDSVYNCLRESGSSNEGQYL